MTRDGIRAVALAVIMVVSMVAVGASFAGSAVAQDGTLVVTDDPGEDEYASISAALDAADPGDTISVQDDQVITSPDNRIVINTTASGASLDGVSIVADGDVTVRYEQPDESGGGVNPGYPTFDVKADNVTISGFNIELDTNDVYDGGDRNAQAIKVGGFQASGGSGVEITDNNISFVGVDNDNIATTGVGLIDPNNGGQLAGATVSGNSIEGFNTGLFAFTTDDGLSGDFDIGANNFQNNDVQYLDNTEQVNGESVFEENTFDNAAFSSSSQGYDDVIHSSIQSAVDSSQSGATVTVNSGTYDENVTVSVEGLSVEGPNAGTPGYDSDRASEATVEGQVVVSADGVVFDGFEVSPPNASTNSGAEALRVSNSADNVTVRNNVVRDFGEDGLPESEGVDGINVFGGDASDSVSNVTVTSNLVEELSGRSTKGGVAGISVQGNVAGADISNNAVRNIGQEATTWAFGITVRGTGNHDVAPTGVSVVNNNISSVLSNPESGTSGVGLGLEAGDTTDVTFEGNNLNDTEFLLEDKTSTLNLTDFVDNNTLDRGALVEGDSAPNIIFNRVQDAQDAASAGDTVTLFPGTYHQSVTVDTESLTIEGPNAGIAPASDERGNEATVLEGISITVDEVRLTGLEIRNPGEQGQADPGSYSGVVGVTVAAGSENVQIDHNVITQIGTGDDDANPIGVLANDGTSGLVVDDNEFSSLEGTDEDKGAVQAILVDESGTPIDDVTVTNNTITDLLDTRSTVAVRFNGDVSGVISNNDISDLNTEGTIPGSDGAPGGFTQVISLAEGGASTTGPSDVSITENTISSIETTTDANFAAPYGVVIGSSTDVASVTLQKNDLSIDADAGEREQTGVAIGSGNTTDTLDATLNYFGNTTPTVQGNVTYDPFLTVEPDEVNATSIEETTKFGHDLVVPADGTPHSVAFPAPVDGTVTEVFGEFNGTVFAYDGDGWESGSEIADEDVGALDAFAVKVDEGESDLRIAFEYANSDAQYPTSADLDEGWNFVGAPESGDSDDAFEVTTTNIATVSHINAGAGSQPYGVTATPPFATNPDNVSPFQGYWVFVTDDGELGATVPVGPTQSNEEAAVAGN